jgi:DNA-binding response OmpR family regulator
MSGEKKRILVAEADAAARMLLRRRLEAEGHDVDVAEDGEVTLQMLADSRPDLLIVDVSLPKIDGIAVVRQLRSVPSSANLPIVVISAHVKDLVDRGLAGVRGPDGYFSKPIDFRELQAKVKTLLSQPAVDPLAASMPLAEPGRLVAFVGAKGGVGTSTIATSVAVALAQQAARTVLVETANFHGTVSTLLGLLPSRPSDQLPLANPEALSLAAITAALDTHPSGLRVLLGAAGGPAPPSDGVFALCNGLRSLASHIVVDLDSAIDSFGQVVLRTAERTWVVTEPERASVERAQALIGMLESWGVNSRAIGLLVNQTSTEMVLEPVEIGHRVGRPVGCWVPYAAGACFEASRRGHPVIEVARDQPLAAALTALAGSMVGRQAVAAR